MAKTQKPSVQLACRGVLCITFIFRLETVQLKASEAPWWCMRTCAGLAAAFRTERRWITVVKIPGTIVKN